MNKRAIAVTAILLALGLTGYFSSLWKKPKPVQPELVQARQTLIDWRRQPFIRIEKTPQFRQFVDSVPVELQTALSPEQEKELRNSLYDFYTAFATGNFDDYKQFVEKRNAVFSYPDIVEVYKDMLEQKKGISGMKSATTETVVRTVWDEYYAKSNGGPVTGLATGGTVILTKTHTGPLETAVLMSEIFKEKNVGGYVSTPYYLGPKIRPDEKVTLAIFRSTVQCKDPDPSIGMQFIMHWSESQKTWIVDAYTLNYSGMRRHVWAF